MCKQKVTNSICVMTKRTLLTRYQLYVIWYRLHSFIRATHCMYYTSVHTQEYISITRVHREKRERENQCTSLKMSSRNVFDAHHKQRETKSRDSFFLHKSFIESIHPIIRFFYRQSCAYICSKINIHLLFREKYAETGKRSIFLHLTLKCNFEESDEHSWAIIYMYIV